MTKAQRSAQQILADQFRLTAEISGLTGEYHRLLQKQAAAGFARQMIEDGPPAPLAEAEVEEDRARAGAEACENRIHALEQRLAALGRELAALH